MNIAGVSSMAPFSGSNQQTTVETGDGHAFAHLLSSLRQKSEPVQPLSEQSEAMQRIDWEQLQQWFAQLPLHDGYAERQTLANEMIQSFLSLLPEETKEQIVQQFSAGQPFETMFSSQDDRNEKDELMLVIALFQLEQKQWTIPEPIVEHARAMLRNVFGTNDEQSNTMKDMLQKLIEFGDSEKTRRHMGQVETGQMQKVTGHPRALFSTVDREKAISDMKYAVARLQEQPWQPIKKEVAPLPQERKQPIVRLSEQMLHVAQQSDDKHVPFDRPTIDTTNETPFVAQFERIVRSSQFTRWKNGNAQMLIRLHPEHLGYITIKLIQQKGKLTAKMITSTEAAKQLVEQHIHQLAHIADHITVEQFNVFDQAKFRDHSFQQQKQQQQQEQQREEKKQPDQSFDEWLKELFHFDV
ncbi:flagellar hook-length control protein FliK [Anoxybacillus kestanbolensis]|uniref:flagellar hook-length control protein FliK n=1 Tax=Anoxybacillus kestanbolensis TaxID=227476 RepID=UPI003D2396F4